MAIYSDILSTVGRSLVIELNRITRGAETTIALKCEFLNPPGSVIVTIGCSTGERCLSTTLTDEVRKQVQT